MQWILPRQHYSNALRTKCLTTLFSISIMWFFLKTLPLWTTHMRLGLLLNILIYQDSKNNETICMFGKRFSPAIVWIRFCKPFCQLDQQITLVKVRYSASKKACGLLSDTVTAESLFPPCITHGAYWQQQHSNKTSSILPLTTKPACMYARTHTHLKKALTPQLRSHDHLGLVKGRKLTGWT